MIPHRTGTMKLGDRILAINGESLYSKTVPEAVRILQDAGDPVSLKISKASRKSSTHLSLVLASVDTSVSGVSKAPVEWCFCVPMLCST